LVFRLALTRRKLLIPGAARGAGAAATTAVGYTAGTRTCVQVFSGTVWTLHIRVTHEQVRRMRGSAGNQGLARPTKNPGSAGAQPGPPIARLCLPVRPATVSIAPDAKEKARDKRWEPRASIPRATICSLSFYHPSVLLRQKGAGSKRVGKTRCALGLKKKAAQRERKRTEPAQNARVDFFA
jgi:hypothetical protein